MNTLDKFKMKDKVVIITGGCGLLGRQHAKVVREAEGIPILWDVSPSVTEEVNGMRIDITSKNEICYGMSRVLERYGKIDVLINNACNNPNPDNRSYSTKLEELPLLAWNQDLAVCLTGAFLCSQVIGTYFANRGFGVILNIASDLGVIAPDQRLYSNDNPKAVTYSVVKHGLIGLTRYLATYWADKNVRVNALSPGGVYTNQNATFVNKVCDLIPMNRMADKDEYKAAVLFLISEASSYMTGSNVIIDGGRTCW